MKYGKKGAVGAAIVGIAVLATVAPGPGSSALAADFYAGKTITIVVGTGAGGGYALAAQLLARHWPTHIPGKPTIIVQAMPGGGGLKMAGFLHNVAPRDGTTIGMPVQTVAMAQVLEPQDVRYDVRNWQWIGNMAVLRQSIVVSHTAPVRSMADARTREVVIGSTARGGNLFIVPKLAKELAGAKFKIILGYRGTSDLDKAIDSGEVQGRGGTWHDWKLRYPDWKKGDKIIPLTLTGTVRDPDAPDVPLLRELVDDPLDKRVIDFFGYTDQLGRTFAAPPGAPKDRVDILRESFAATMKDQRMIEDAAKRGIPMDPAGWREVEKVVLETANIAPEVVTRMREVLAR